VVLSWLARRPHCAPRTSCPPRLEALEDLTLLSTLFVTNTLDDGSVGSLRAAVISAQGGDTIRFDPSLANAKITLQGVIPITTSLTIDGLGADQLEVKRQNSNPSQFRLFDVGVGINVTLYGLRLSDGFDPLGDGGAIRNAGALAVNACWLDGNTSAGAAGGL